MKKKCFVCNKKTEKQYQYIFCTRKCYLEAFKDPESVNKEINKYLDNIAKERIKLKENIEKIRSLEINNFKSPHKRKYFKVRRLVNMGEDYDDIYGITLPKIAYENYKGYFCEVYSNGMIALIPTTDKHYPK